MDGLSLTPASEVSLASQLTPEQVLEQSETKLAKAQLLTEEIEQEQFLTLRELIAEQTAATERILRAADEIEVMMEVLQQRIETLQKPMEEIKEVIAPTPTAENSQEEKPPVLTAKKTPGWLI